MNQPELFQSLRQGLTALGLEPDSCPCEAYLQYLELLVKWNRAYSLTGVRDRQRMIHAHVLDSLAVLPYIRGDRCLDVGTGAGLPGFILALTQPEVHWTLLDSNGKKVKFLRQLLFVMKTDNVEIVHCRAEKFLSSVAYSSIIFRAFGSLSACYEAVQHLLQPGARLLAMKGRMPDTELQAVSGAVKSITVRELPAPGLDASRRVVLLER